MVDFKNKTIWITGASSGIGKALAISLSEEDTNLILSSRNEEGLNKVKELCKQPEMVKVLPLDLEEHSSFDDKVNEALNLFDGVDILINNGGLSQRSLTAETGLKVDKQLFDVNYFGTIGLTKALLPHFITKESGQIVVVSSVMGKFGTPLRSAYAASKHALHGFFDSLRAELFNKNIKVTIICPGYVNTQISKNALSADGSKHNQMDNATANGLSPEVFAQKALKAIAKQKQEVVIGGFKETSAAYLKRFFPNILSKVIRKVNVT
ncbi:MAG: SDR family oxidoreductase [Bacteroidota bacterium]